MHPVHVNVQKRRLRGAHPIPMNESMALSTPEEMQAEIVRLRKEVARLKGASTLEGVATEPTIPAVVFHIVRTPTGNDELRFVSGGCRKLFAISPGEMLSDPRYPWCVIADCDLPRVRESVETSARLLQSWDCEFRIVDTLGNEKWVHGSAGVARTPEGGVQWRGVMIDVTGRRHAEDRLAVAHEELQRVIDSVPGCLWSVLIDAQGNFHGRYLSSGSLRVLGRPPEFFLEDMQHRWFEIIHPDDQSRIQKLAERIERGEAITEEEQYRVIFPDGSVHWVRDCVTIKHAGDGSRVLYGATIDVTPQQQAAEALQRAHLELEHRVHEQTAQLLSSQEAFRRESDVLESVLNCMADGVLVVDENGHFVRFNPAAERLIGRGPTDEQSEAWPDYFGLFLPDQKTKYPADQLPSTLARFGEVVREAEVFVRNSQHPQGASLSVNASPLYNREGRLSGAVVVMRDITAHKRYREQLLAEEALLRKLLELQERDRKLVSYEIHDGLLQYVVGAKMIVESICQSSDGNARELGKTVRRLLGNAIVDGRAVIAGLRPMVIDDQGIVGAIEYLISDEPIRKLEVDFRHDVAFDRLDPRLEQAVFRIVQEALTNVSRHSQATAASITLTQRDHRLQLQISDSGVGFNLDDIPSDRFGVRGILERARLFGGSAKIATSPGKGTQITVDIPLASQDGTPA